MREIKIGKQTFEIHYGQNAICALEEELDSSIVEILSRIEKGRAKLADLRAIVWAGMLSKRRNITPETVGNIFDVEGVKIRSVAFECVEELSTSFTRYIVEDDEPREDEGKND